MNTHDLRSGTEKQSSLGQKMLSQAMVRLLEPAGAALIQLMEQDSFQKFPTELLRGVFLYSEEKQPQQKTGGFAFNLKARPLFTESLVRVSLST